MRPLLKSALYVLAMIWIGIVVGFLAGILIPPDHLSDQSLVLSCFTGGLTSGLLGVMSRRWGSNFLIPDE